MPCTAILIFSKNTWFRSRKPPSICRSVTENGRIIRPCSDGPPKEPEAANWNLCRAVHLDWSFGPFFRSGDHGWFGYGPSDCWNPGQRRCLRIPLLIDFPVKGIQSLIANIKEGSITSARFSRPAIMQEGVGRRSGHPRYLAGEPALAWPCSTSDLPRSWICRSVEWFIQSSWIDQAGMG